MDSSSPFGSFLKNLSGEWQINLESRIPRQELYEARIASSKPSPGFFVLLLCAAVIATLGLISNSAAVVIGAMIVAPLMDPILSLAFALSISNNKLAKRSLLTVVIGVLTVIATSALLASLLDVSEVNREMTSRTAPNLIDLGIAVAAAVAGSFSMTRERLSNSLAGVAVAVALVPPLCVCGIGLSMGKEVVAVFGRGTVAGITNQISEGSFLLFLANLIGITVASLFVFLVQRYGSILKCWRNLLLWLGLLGLLCIPLSSALHDFSIRALKANSMLLRQDRSVSSKLPAITPTSGREYVCCSVMSKSVTTKPQWTWSSAHQKGCLQKTYLTIFLQPL